MADHSAIEWTEATWNPVTGCTKVSPGCDHCYAERIVERFHGKGSFGTVVRSEEKVYLPMRWRKPRRIFVNSMSDLFHDDVPDSFVANVFSVMARTPRHTYQVLTKRHGRMLSLLRRPSFRDNLAHLAPWPLPNVWLGVSVEDQKWADIRIPALTETPAAVRWLSCEPLLGPLDLSPWLVDHGDASRPWGIPLDWVVVGGESGPGARPMHPDWARTLRDQCVSAGVPFFFKQWGEWIPESLGAHVITGHTAETARYADLLGGDRPARYGARNGAATCHRVGKKRAGRSLDGRTWDEYPAVTP